MISASFVPKGWDLNPAIRARLGEEVGRQRLMEEGNELLLILHEPPRVEDDERRRGFLLWASPTTGWKSTPEPGGLAGLEGLLQRYAEAIHDLDAAMEQAQLPREHFLVMRRAHPLLRATRNLLTVMEEARKTRREERHLLLLRDRAVELERAMDLVASDAKSAMEFSIAQNAQTQAQAAWEASCEARRLNRLAAFFFPLMTLVAVFGMSAPRAVLGFEGLWLVLGVGISLGAVVLLLVATRGRED